MIRWRAEGCYRLAQCIGIEASDPPVADDGKWHRAVAERDQLVVGAVVLVDVARGERHVFA